MEFKLRADAISAATVAKTNKKIIDSSVKMTNAISSQGQMAMIAGTLTSLMLFAKHTYSERVTLVHHDLLQFLVILLLLFSSNFTYRKLSALRKDMSISLPISESEIKREGITFKQGFLLKVEFVLKGSPTEVLHTLQNQKQRKLWDIDLKELQENVKENSIRLIYNASDRSMPAFNEDVRLEYMMHNGAYYIVEEAKSQVLGRYNRVWILRPLGSAYMVTFLG